MEQYTEATTVHGFRYLHSKNSWVARVFWICIILTVLGLVVISVHESILKWESKQTITTLESIATPIQNIQFPTVTVCPHENSEPDNWAFLEKIFDSIQLDESGAEKVKDEITDKQIEKLYEMLLSKHSSSNDSQFWFENFDTEKFEELFSEASSSVCKKEIDSEDMKIIAVKNFGKSYTTIEPFIKGLDDLQKENKTKDLTNEECFEWLEQHNLNGTLNVLQFLYHRSLYSKLSFGTFMVNFANLTSANISNLNEEWSTFDLEPMQFRRKYPSEICLYCEKISTYEKDLHSYFKELGIANGFKENSALSLFDLPSMLSTSFDAKDWYYKYVIFLLHNC